MPKIYKLTENQIIALKEHIKTVKTLQEDISVPDELSPAAAGYYKQNNLKPKVEEVIPEEEVPVANPAEDKKIADALVTLGLQVIPGTEATPQPTTTKPAAPTPGSTEALQAAKSQGDAGLIGEVEPVSNAKPEYDDFEDTPNLPKPVSNAKPEYAEVETMYGDYNFKTYVNISSLEGDAVRAYCVKNNYDVPEDGDIDISGKLVVNWSIKIETDEAKTGVTNIKGFVNSVSGDLIFGYYPHEDVFEMVTFTKPFNPNEWKIISDDILTIKDNTITITDVELYWPRMELTVS